MGEEGAKSKPGTIKTVFTDESKEDRITRLMKILLATTSIDDASYDKVRAMKTLEKIDQVDFTVELLRKTGIGKIIAKLAKKHSDAVIRDHAEKIYAKWKALAVSIVTFV
jgi:hypothetical protein